ncbi:PIN domain-containing protein [Candidatus Woesearchaeota archaeon]|nr:PIN domain-containing protein [Candidatus Woesearchaeota archaeon]
MNAVDTNILVYAFDAAYPEKRNVCQRLVSAVFEGKLQAVVTNQILAEFVFVVMQKIENPLAVAEARAVVGAIMTSANWRVFNYTPETILKALEFRLPFWDSLIVETLKENGVGGIITENTKDFLNSGIKVVNPF